MSLRDRCSKMVINLRGNTHVNAHGSLVFDNAVVDDLMAFVISETGRMAANARLEKDLPLCLYFANDEDREYFIEVIKEVYPNMKSRKMP